MENTTNFVVMVKQMVTGHNPQADAQKTGRAFKKGHVNRVLSFINVEDGSEYESEYEDAQFYKPSFKITRIKMPEKSGWQMARIV
jgi:hypothetical protein